MFISRVSFKDMLEKAKAQSDIYTADEDSEDEDFEPYNNHCEDYVEYVDKVLPPVAVHAPEFCALAAGDCPLRKPAVSAGLMVTPIWR